MKPKPALQRVLYIGDSHSVGIFGHSMTTLIQDALSKHVALMAVASCGSEPRWWLDGKTTSCGLRTLYPNGFDDETHKAQTPKIAELLNIAKPKITIVQLGSNLVLMGNEEREKSTDTMMDLIEKKGGQCVWISAPDSRKFSAAEIGNVYELLKKLAKKHHCKLIDSRKYTKYPAGGDGLHYGGKDGAPIAKYWAEKVFVNAVKPELAKNFTLAQKSPVKLEPKIERPKQIQSKKREAKQKTHIQPPRAKTYADKKRK
ncbi:MAG: hypothetical protein PHQ03_11620 [Methylococcales bacterium]|nr:hypothetical protein [Methylococcales bacterium]